MAGHIYFSVIGHSYRRSQTRILVVDAHDEIGLSVERAEHYSVRFFLCREAILTHGFSATIYV